MVYCLVPQCRTYLTEFRVSSGIDAWVKLNTVPASFEIKTGHRPGESDDVVAWGSFQNAINETGFGFLEIYTNEKLPDEYQAYAAGFLEGYLTKDLIRMHFDNQWADYCVNETAYCKKLYHFFSENVRHMNEQAAQYRSSSAYWHQLLLALSHPGLFLCPDCSIVTANMSCFS
ncbi:hypothetical protein HPB49_020338 [Dermacentor silvarum]|uniref:Uncharacterized protein n=1 Tax=Dermacentor silvarum TaxID=543639 RepID=A0ACB8CSX0_DERSI|nr:hypothetical protein HPB49_020338 [Dermacentor silvarum]